MSVLYVRCRMGPLPPPRLQHEESLPTPDHDRVLRVWQVSIRVDDEAPVLTTITDPFTEEEYKTVFEAYLRNSDARNKKLEEDGGGGGASKVSRMEARIQAYGQDLLGQLGIRPGIFKEEKKNDTVQIYVVEHHHGGDDRAGGVHCLAWELLEAVQVPWMPALQLRITRISDFPSSPPRNRTQRLWTTQQDPDGILRILLVVARDFSRTGRGPGPQSRGDAKPEPEPDLAQWPLMSAQKKLGGRMLLEVVRPGSLEALEHHLRVRARVGVVFHLVHFDLHGRIMRDENGNQVPWLLFAKRRAARSNGSQLPGTHLAKAQAVASLLSQYQIENVVLNACLSAYNPSKPDTNLAHVFLERGGVQNVSAMWFYVHWRTAATYLDAFYRELLVVGVGFHVAAQKGREAVRACPTGRKGVVDVDLDFFLCVNYARDDVDVDVDVQRSSRLWREASPAPSTRSQDSSTSNGSMRRKGRRRKRGFMSKMVLHNEEPPITRMKLHLLELEYKLITFRTVYASDLRKTGSDLEGTIERMVDMWLATNLVDEVCYYEARDFATRSRRRVLTGEVRFREKRTRISHCGYLHPPLQLQHQHQHQHQHQLQHRALWQTLHIIRGVDPIVDPGHQADELANCRSEERRVLAQAALERFARRLRRGNRDTSGTGTTSCTSSTTSYLLILGSQDVQWWGRHLRGVGGGWWVDVPWDMRVRGRHG